MGSGGSQQLPRRRLSPYPISTEIPLVSHHLHRNRLLVSVRARLPVDFWVLRRRQDERRPPLARPDPAFLAAPQGFPLWRAVTFVVSWACLALAIALVYRILPDAKIAWRDVWVGAGVRALLFLLGNHLIGWYLAATSITSVYGAAGSIVIVLRWVYHSSQIVLFGAEFTRVYTKHRGSPLEPQENAMRITRKEYA
jgi:hypothetical protein